MAYKVMRSPLPGLRYALSLSGFSSIVQSQPLKRKLLRDDHSQLYNKIVYRVSIERSSSRRNKRQTGACGDLSKEGFHERNSLTDVSDELSQLISYQLRTVTHGRNIPVGFLIIRRTNLGLSNYRR